MRGIRGSASLSGSSHRPSTVRLWPPRVGVFSDIPALLKMVIDRKASDLHLKVKSPPVLRINGHLMPADLPPYEPAELLSLIESMLTERQRETFRRELELDFGYGVPGLSRFRVNVFRQRGNIGAAIRTIPMEVPTMPDLALPDG